MYDHRPAGTNAIEGILNAVEGIVAPLMTTVWTVHTVRIIDPNLLGTCGIGSQLDELPSPFRHVVTEIGQQVHRVCHAEKEGITETILRTP